MTDDWQAHLEGQISQAIDARGDVAPPWARHPEIPSGSIGWRMGYGESWLMLWHAWLSRQPTDRAWRLAYLRRHPPAPRTWDRTAIDVLAPDRDAAEDVEAALLAELEAAGAIGDDVAILAWEALHGDAPAAPWIGRGDEATVAESARYGARELDFWARWCASRRQRGELERWLSAAPPAPPGWQALRDAAARGRADDPTGRSAYERLGVLLAAHGHAPAPWTLGEPPKSLRGKTGDTVTYADAWHLWVLERFDDTPTWRRYLDSQGPIPRAWAGAIARVIDWL